MQSYFNTVKYLCQYCTEIFGTMHKNISRSQKYCIPNLKIMWRR